MTVEKNLNPRIRISVLMAIYNCADTLEEALDSLFIKQTYQGFKVILCDDCSTDNTYNVASAYTKKYPDRIILLRNEKNLKLPATLNKCLEYADTEFIARMDGDDLSKPERFEKEINFLDSNKIFSLVSCAMEFFDENGVFKTAGKIPIPRKSDLKNMTPFCHAPVMIRTKALKAVNGYTVEKWTERGQDYHLWAKLLCQGFVGYNLTEPLYMMRDDKKAFKRRDFKSRMLAVKRRYKIYQLADIPYWHLWRTLLHAVATSIIPYSIYKKIHRR